MGVVTDMYEGHASYLINIQLKDCYRIAKSLSYVTMFFYFISLALFSHKLLRGMGCRDFLS